MVQNNLVKRLTQYQDVSDYHVIAVFDGQGSKTSDDSQEGGIQIFYSSAKATADSIIERLVAKYGSTHDLTVVTNDHLEQQTASTFGALTISVDLFLQWISDADKEVAHQLKKLRRNR